MRSILPACAVFAVVAFATPAQAQFGNSGLALTFGYFGVSEDEAVSIDGGFPIGLEGTRYIENGFESYLRFQVMLLRPNIGDQTAIGVAPALGIRYLFAEEMVRPYVGIDLSYLHLFNAVPGLVVDRVGPGANLGIEFFVSDSVAIGARAQTAMYLALDRQPYFSYGASAVAATYF